MIVIEQDGFLNVTVPGFRSERFSPIEMAKLAVQLLRRADSARSNHLASVDLIAVGYPGLSLDPAEAVEWALAWFHAAASAVCQACPVCGPAALATA